ncbi:glucose-1-phosphate thymidylyltransferase RfbA [Gammaproteobacteria bacterium]|jgi:glucose-1-phosphate thymidylyltransferase|nr:glucose-1-phosphate thymidylyltransferase RfbA [Gammaproteobacteria bacterium]MDA9626377.1 glucose-1-phosphate thymidylyltransferase RfbA [Pseudomonadota bacterium]
MNNFKGIILAGGSGTRLYPLTKGVSKQLLPIFDKPMIYYPLSVLMLSGIQDIQIISTPTDIGAYQRLLGDGDKFGLNISYAVQENPEGLAQSFIIAKDFIGHENVCLVLGDNIFYGQDFSSKLKIATSKSSGATIFGYEVSDPSRFGVVEFDSNYSAISIEEKPVNPKSNYAVTGLYFYDNSVVEIAENLQPSPRGELEITDINKIFLKNNNLDVARLGRGFNWYDTGTVDALFEATAFVRSIQLNQGIQVACPEEIAFNSGWISAEELEVQATALSANLYGKYLKNLLNQ